MASNIAYLLASESLCILTDRATLDTEEWRNTRASRSYHCWTSMEMNIFQCEFAYFSPKEFAYAC